MKDIIKNILKHIDLKAILIAIFLFIVRLYVDLYSSTPSLSSYALIDEAKILIKGTPLIQGITIPRGYPAFPIAVYIYLPFVIIGSAIGVKVLDAFLYTVLFFLTYIISKVVVKNEPSALLAALFVAVMPIHIFFLNNASLIYISLIFYIATIYFFIKKRERKSTSFILLLTFLCLITPLAFLIATSLLIYILIIKISKKKVDKEEVEISIFFFMFALWKSLILFKNSIASYKISLQSTILHIVFPHEFHLFIEIIVPILLYTIISIIGLVSVRKEKERLVWIISINIMLLTLSYVLSIISTLSFIISVIYLLSPGMGRSIEIIIEKIKTILSKVIRDNGSINKVAVSIYVIIIIISLVAFSYKTSVYGKLLVRENSPYKEEIFCLKELNKYPNGKVAHLEGDEYFIHYYSNKKVFAVRGVESKKIYKVLEELLTTPSETRALEIVKELNVKYIYFSERYNKKPINNEKSTIYEIEETLEKANEANKALKEEKIEKYSGNEKYEYVYGYIKKEKEEELNRLKLPLYINSSCFKLICKNSVSAVYEVVC